MVLFISYLCTQHNVVNCAEATENRDVLSVTAIREQISMGCNKTIKIKKMLNFKIMR